jgi:probable rRNA maturation factor
MRDLQLRNRQRAKRLSTEFLGGVVRTLLEEVLGLDEFELAIHFVNEKQMAEMNEQFLKHQGSTDVITFDYREGYAEGESFARDLAGEIYISVPDAIKQAREFSTTWEEELVRYIVHGVLHLQGYDDLEPAGRKVMKREENRLLRRLRERFSLRKVGG